MSSSQANIPAPNFEHLLPPFLAHIPIAFSSSKAPPSLLPLLAPILRSRVRLLSGGSEDTINSPEDSWLSLLTWSSFNAQPLCESLAAQDFTPHPSGEFEIGEYAVRGVQRLDSETLKTCVELSDRGIDVSYLWVDEKEDPEEGSGWKIVEVNLSSQRKETGEWYPTVIAAEKAYPATVQKENVKPTPTATTVTTTASASSASSASLLSSKYPYLPPPSQAQPDMNEDDDDYWDMYDRSPARTPAVNHQGMKAPSEDEYFARYSTVSPALDRGDEAADSIPYPPPRPLQPQSQAQPQPLPQTLPTTTTPLSTLASFPSIPISPPTSTPSKPSSLTSNTPPRKEGPSSTSATVYSSPRPTSPQSVIQKLEEKVNVQEQTETAVKQHISTTMKSLYRLAKMSGIDRDEFERIVETELAVIGVLEEEEEGGIRSW
ncbi:hypothetical protein DFH27DRAFT_298260 [Peziza echinospora]|nr:hypothetical protein DFH27DRAFT_298260 [Peziza echinospora]